MAKDFVGKGKSIYTKTYTSFSGCDMVATIDIAVPNKNGQTVKVSRVIGELQTISYSIHMDKAPVRSIGSVNAKDYVFGPRTIAGSLVFAMFDKHMAHEILMEANKGLGSDMSQMLVMDEMPPFNITISMANEYGQKARLAIYQIRIVNEGNVMSVNDVYTENTYQFVATDIEYLTNNSGSASSGTSRASELYLKKNTYAVAGYSSAKPIPTSAIEGSSSAEDVFINEGNNGSFQMFMSGNK